MQITLDKKYTTRDGRDVIVHAIDGPNKDYPVVISVKNSEDSWYVSGRTIEGKLRKFDPIEDPGDLIEVLPVKVGQRYRKDDNEYILAQVERGKYALINLSSGNRWEEPVYDIDDVFCNKHFELIE